MTFYSPSERVHAWEELRANPAWKELLEAISAQRDQRAQIILRDELTPDNVYDRERLRGEWAALELTPELAETLYEVAVQDLTNAAKEQENVPQEQI